MYVIQHYGTLKRYNLFLVCLYVCELLLPLYYFLLFLSFKKIVWKTYKWHFRLIYVGFPSRALHLRYLDLQLMHMNVSLNHHGGFINSQLSEKNSSYDISLSLNFLLALLIFFLCPTWQLIEIVCLVIWWAFYAEEEMVLVKN